MVHGFITFNTHQLYQIPEGLRGWVLPVVEICLFKATSIINHIQKWLPLNNSFVHIQNSLTNLVQDNKFFTIFVSKNEVSEAILNTKKRII